MTDKVAKKDTSLIYLNNDGYVWMQEHGIGAKHPEKAVFYCEVPGNEDKSWIVGKPKVDNIQFLTLCPFYPSQRLDVSIEINRTPKTSQYPNHQPFDGCVKYMPISLLKFKPIPKHVERAIHTIGLCHYEHIEPYKTVEVPSDNQMDAIKKGRAILRPSIVETVKHISVRPNPAYDEYVSTKKPKIRT